MEAICKECSKIFNYGGYIPAHYCNNFKKYIGMTSSELIKILSKDNMTPEERIKNIESELNKLKEDLSKGKKRELTDKLSYDDKYIYFTFPQTRQLVEPITLQLENPINSYDWERGISLTNDKKNKKNMVINSKYTNLREGNNIKYIPIFNHLIEEGWNLSFTSPNLSEMLSRSIIA